MAVNTDNISIIPQGIERPQPEVAPSLSLDNEPLSSISESPISRLPVEMLREVFMCIYIGLDRRWRGGASSRWTIISILKVCRLWHDVALSVPTLWTEIDLSLPDFSEECLRRSKALPISVIFNQSPQYYRGQTNPLLLKSNIDALSPRTVDLELSVRDSDIVNVLNALRESQWEKLKDINIDLSHDYDPERPAIREILQPNIWHWNLRRITLSNVLIPLNSSFYNRNLTSLRLQSLRGVVLMDELFEFLHNQPQLEELAIVYQQSWRQYISIPLTARTRFTHKNLRVLSLCGVCDSEAATQLFDKIFTKAYLELSLDAKAGLVCNPFPPDHPVAQRLDRLETISIEIDKYKFTINDHKHVHQFFYPLPSLAENHTDVIRLQALSYFEDPIARFAREYGSTCCKHLIITFCDIKYLVEYEGIWTTLLHHFPNLESLHVQLFKPYPVFRNLFAALTLSTNTTRLKWISAEGLSDVLSDKTYSQPLRQMHEEGRGLDKLKLLFKIPCEGFVACQVQDILRSQGDDWSNYLKPWVGQFQVLVTPDRPIDHHI